MNNILPRKFGNKRGISPILATLLLIVIAIAAILVTYAWITAYIGGGTHQAGARIEFDEAFINATSNKVTIYVRNKSPSGEPVTIDRVYIEGTDVTTHCKADGQDLPVTLQADEVIELTITNTGINFTAGQYYKIKVSGPETYWEQSIQAEGQ